MTTAAPLRPDHSFVPAMARLLKLAATALPEEAPREVSSGRKPTPKHCRPQPPDLSPVIAGQLPSLFSRLGEVPESRSRQGRRHSLQSILTLVCLGMLSGVHGYERTVIWARALPGPVRCRLGFREGKIPAPSTLFEVLRLVEWSSLETVLRDWVEDLTAAGTPPLVGPGDPQALAIDGKALRGTAKRAGEMAGLLAVVSHDTGLQQAQEMLERKTGEVTGLRKLLKELPLHGRVVTVDAGFTHRDLAQTILDRGGDYCMKAKLNQPNLLAAVMEQLSQEQFHPERRSSYLTHDAGHGRHEDRHLITQILPQGTLDWPGARQAFVLIETRTSVKKQQVCQRRLSYGITSLPPEHANAERLLKLVRGHWSVENKAFWIRDVLLREDRCAATNENIVAVLALLRTATYNLLRCAATKSLSSAQLTLQANVSRALKVLGCPP